MALIPARADGSRPQVALLGLASLPIVGLLIFTIGMAVGTRPAHVPILALALVSGLLVLVPLILDQGRAPERRHVFFTLISISWGIAFVLPVFTRYFLEGGYDPSMVTSVLGVHPSGVVNAQIIALLGYVSMVVGFQGLVWVAAAFYLCSLLSGAPFPQVRRARQADPARGGTGGGEPVGPEPAHAAP